MRLLGRFRRERDAMTFEHSMLRTATLCLIAFGAVMVYSASSGTSLLSQGGDSSLYLKRYLLSAGLGLVAMALMVVVEQIIRESLLREHIVVVGELAR